MDAHIQRQMHVAEPENIHCLQPIYWGRHDPKLNYSIASIVVLVPVVVIAVGWLGSRVVSVPDSGVEGLRQTAHIHRASVHKAAKLVAALLRVAEVTAGLAESNGSLPPGL